MSVAGELNVEVVAADRKVWSGTANLVVARTTEGEIGIMPGHEPLLGLLVTGSVTVRSADGSSVIVAIDRGFLSISQGHVAVLVEAAQLAEEIDTASVEQELAAAGDDHVAVRWAETRLHVAGAR